MTRTYQNSHSTHYPVAIRDFFGIVSMVTALRDLRLGVLLFAAGAMLLPCSAVAFMPVKYAGHSSAISDSFKVKLARHLPRIEALDLEVIIIIASGDSWDANTSNAKQMSLSKARANAVRQFFLDAGIAEQRLYAQGQSAPFGPTRELFSAVVPPSGYAVIEYIGTCKYGYDAVFCEEETPDAMP